MEEIIKMEDRRLKAMTQTDTAALDQILADDLTYTHSSGMLETKAQFIDSLKSGRVKYESVECDEVKVRDYGATAVVTGFANFKVQSGGRGTSFRVRFTDIYVNRGDLWQMVAWQSTRLPE
jgi:hypothetical protein